MDALELKIFIGYGSEIKFHIQAFKTLQDRSEHWSLASVLNNSLQPQESLKPVVQSSVTTWPFAT